MVPFAEEAENRLEQDPLMLSAGIHSNIIRQRLQRYRKYMHESMLQSSPLVQNNWRQTALPQ